MNISITAAAKQEYRNLLPARRHSCRAFVRPQTSGLQAVFLTPDTRLVATAPRGRSGISRHLTEKAAALFGQITRKMEAHAGCRADKASIGERLSAVPGMRCADPSNFEERLSLVPDMRCADQLNGLGET